MKNLFLILIIWVSFAQLAHCQNLVKNWSFEDTIKCPEDASQLERAKYWINPTAGTPDLFNACFTDTPYPPMNPNVGVPYNYFGYQEAKTGKGYAAAIFFYKGSPNVREYMATELIKPLEVGKKYYVSFYVSLMDSASYATDDIGLYLSKEKIIRDLQNDWDTLAYVPQIRNPEGNIIKDKKNWTLISGEFIGNGEKWIVIGNFKTDTDMDTLFMTDGHFSQDPNDKHSHYWVDDVCVSENKDSCNMITSTNLINNDKQSHFYYSNNELKFNFPNEPKLNDKVFIYNSLGSLVQTFTLTEKNCSFDIADWQNGLYFVSLFFNNQFTHFKVLKQ